MRVQTLEGLALASDMKLTFSFAEALEKDILLLLSSNQIEEQRKNQLRTYLILIHLGVFEIAEHATFTYIHELRRVVSTSLPSLLDAWAHYRFMPPVPESLVGYLVNINFDSSELESVRRTIIAMALISRDDYRLRERIDNELRNAIELYSSNYSALYHLELSTTDLEGREYVRKAVNHAIELNSVLSKSHCANMWLSSIECFLRVSILFEQPARIQLLINLKERL